MVNITNNFQNVTNLKEVLEVTNSTTGGFGWISLLVMMQVIILMALLPFGFTSAILASAFIAFVVGLFFTYLNLVSWTHLMIFLGQILILIIYIGWEQRNN